LENNDRILFNEISKGNKAAFDTLFRKYYSQLVRFAIGFLHDGPTAEEIVQEVFVKIWENAPRILITTTVPGYLYSSVKNHCLNYLKHENTKRKYEKEQAEVSSLQPAGTTENVNIAFFMQMLARTVGLLPEKCREIFEMAKFDGLSYEEIAEYLEVSVKTVENQMGIALKKLREAMQPYSNRIYEQ
jgi:RNA polymerase sigma-70 factor, ECF subfamily